MSSKSFSLARYPDLKLISAVLQALRDERHLEQLIEMAGAFEHAQVPDEMVHSPLEVANVVASLQPADQERVIRLIKLEIPRLPNPADQPDNGNRLTRFFESLGLLKLRLVGVLNVLGV